MNSSQSYGKQKVRFNHSKKACAQEEISFRCLHFLYTGYFNNHREIEVLIDWSRNRSKAKHQSRLGNVRFPTHSADWLMIPPFSLVPPQYSVSSDR